MSGDYPVQIEVTSPARFDRIQLLLRIALAIGLAWVGITAGWLVCTLYVVLPLIAAVAVSSLGAQYLPVFAPRLWRALSWLVQLSAYMMLLVDRFPTGDDDAVQANVRFTGRPTIGAALVRLLTSIPSMAVLFVLMLVSGFLWLIGAGLILLGGPMPASILAFQRGVLRWQARLIAYHASLVEEYPPFSFETGSGRGATLAASGAP